MNKKLSILFLVAMVPALAWTASNLAPGGDGQGSVGTAAKPWGAGYFSTFYATNVQAQPYAAVVNTTTTLVMDATASIMGLPKIALTTNMVTATRGAGTNVLITVESFTNAFDNDFTTATSTGVNTVATTDTANYQINLGAVYSGFYVITFINVQTVGNMLYSSRGGRGMLNVQGRSAGGQYIGSAAGDLYLISNNPGTTTNTMTKMFFGDTIHFTAAQFTASGVNLYAVRDVSIWGATNIFSGYEGTP